MDKCVENVVLKNLTIYKYACKIYRYTNETSKLKERGNEQVILAASDVSDVPEPDDQTIRPIASERLERNDIINDIRTLLEQHDNPANILQQYIEEVEERIEEEGRSQLEMVDKESIKTLIERHPFFKNPNNYHIRLITIMKYLKKKGVDINIPDMDLLVDEIIQTIDGVNKKAYGQYSRVKHG